MAGRGFRGARTAGGAWPRCACGAPNVFTMLAGRRKVRACRWFRRSRPNCSSGRRKRPLQLARVTVARVHRADAAAHRRRRPASGEVGRRARSRGRRGTRDGGQAGRRPAALGARVHAGGDAMAFEFVVAEPGWTMYMVSHFHYDPVWWNTQGAYTSEWREDPPGRCRQTNGFELVHAHLEMARREPEYKFVLAEVDYLKPYWDTRPEDRADLRRFLIAKGRVEVMGGTYNEPNTNLTSPETTIRNFVHGIGFQRDVLGADPATAWQLDVFGHDPQFPGMAADAGLTSSSWARGPHHQWGPAMAAARRRRRAHAVLPASSSGSRRPGRGLLTHYMPAHYSAGWWMDSSTSLAEARGRHLRAVRPAQEGCADPQRAAAGRHRLHPAEQVGHRDPPRLGRSLHLAAVRVRTAAGVLRGGAGRTGRAGGGGRRRRPAT